MVLTKGAAKANVKNNCSETVITRTQKGFFLTVYNIKRGQEKVEIASMLKESRFFWLSKRKMQPVTLKRIYQVDQ